MLKSHGHPVVLLWILIVVQFFGLEEIMLLFTFAFKAAPIVPFVVRLSVHDRLNAVLVTIGRERTA